ncbi:MAG: HAD-IIIC family phosphatase [Magnetovibrio sp.]|nr:HAD-IIIC family phosphatase [Magnetovibrio sp.]
MNFLDARKTLKGFSSENKTSIFLGMSGTVNQLCTYVRAYAAYDNIDAHINTVSFGALSQALIQLEESAEREIYVLFPWDFAAELDWRSGVSDTVGSPNTLLEHATFTANQFKSRKNAKFVYIPAPVLPIFSDVNDVETLSHSILSLARDLGAKVISPNVFTLGGYLSTGSPLRGENLSDVAKVVWSMSVEDRKENFKVLVTDLDGVLWSGMIAEDGLSGIECEPEGRGYSHFLYQGLLRKLKASGIVLAAVSRNDLDVALSPFKASTVHMVEDDFVAIIASYEAKSAQIRMLADQLNLGLDSFVFIDDNPVELAEVSTSLPQVLCIEFPSTDDDFVEFVVQVSEKFSREVVTDDDRDRSEMYRRRLGSMPPSDEQGANIDLFLRGLEMKLTLHDRSSEGWERAVQLINKTNQFNLNGNRINPEDVAKKLALGARLISGELSDRTGRHGEVIACLVEPDGLVSSFIMSCRVFQRLLEYAFIVCVLQNIRSDLIFAFKPTDRNSAIKSFLADTSFHQLENGMIGLAGEDFCKRHKVDLDMFETNDSAFD